MYFYKIGQVTALTQLGVLPSKEKQGSWGRLAARVGGGAALGGATAGLTGGNVGTGALLGGVGGGALHAGRSALKDPRIVKMLKERSRAAAKAQKTKGATEGSVQTLSA